MPEDVLEWRTEPEFVGSQTCRKCHPDQFESFRETVHSRALEEVLPECEPADAAFDDQRTARRYRTTHAQGQLIHEVNLLLENGNEVLQSQFPVRYRFGSGHFGRGYLVATNGFLIESPISWFESRRAWALSPGFEAAEQVPFGRTIVEGCLSCHSGHVERSTVSDLRMQIVEPQIGCERCHGPGKTHVEQEMAGRVESAGGNRAIVNPRRLPPRLAEAVCHQCHLQGDIRVPGRGIHAEGFRAGESLEKYRQEYSIRKPRLAMPAVGHVGQLTRSACYRESHRLSCVTCHNPHAALAAEDRSEHYRTVCLSCHQEAACKLDLPQRVEQRQNDCAACHMPSQATDMPHVAFTHHQIGRHPVVDEVAPADSTERLVPLFDPSELSDGDRQRSLGLAWQGLLLSPKAGIMTASDFRQIAARARQLLTTLPAEFVDGSVELGLSRLHFVCGEPVEAEVAARRVLDFEALATADKIGALTIVASACREQRRWLEAAEWFTELTRVRRDADDWDYLGECELELGNIEAAIRALHRSREIDPDNPRPCHRLARIYRVKKDIAAEMRLQEEADQLDRRQRRVMSKSR